MGPIHFAETLPALVLFATIGLLRLVSSLHERLIPHSVPVTAIVAYIMGGLALFSGVHSYGLRAQAANSRVIYEAVESAGVHDAIVIGDQPAALIHNHPLFKRTGSWVHWFPPPDPYFRDDVVFAYASADPEDLRRRFPDRKLYRMTYHLAGQPVRISEVE